MKISKDTVQRVIDNIRKGPRLPTPPRTTADTIREVNEAARPRSGQTPVQSVPVSGGASASIPPSTRPAVSPRSSRGGGGSRRVVSPPSSPTPVETQSTADTIRQVDEATSSSQKLSSPPQRVVTRDEQVRVVEQQRGSSSRSQNNFVSEDSDRGRLTRLRSFRSRAQQEGGVVGGAKDIAGATAEVLVDLGTLSNPQDTKVDTRRTFPFLFTKGLPVEQEIEPEPKRQETNFKDFFSNIPEALEKGAASRGDLLRDDPAKGIIVTGLDVATFAAFTIVRGQKIISAAKKPSPLTSNVPTTGKPFSPVDKKTIVALKSDKDIDIRSVPGDTQLNLKGDVAATPETPFRSSDFVPVKDSVTRRLTFKRPDSKDLRSTAQDPRIQQKPLQDFGFSDPVILKDTQTNRFIQRDARVLEDFLSEQPGRFEVVGRPPSVFTSNVPTTSQSQVIQRQLADDSGGFLFAFPIPVSQFRSPINSLSGTNRVELRFRSTPEVSGPSPAPLASKAQTASTGLRPVTALPSDSVSPLEPVLISNIDKETESLVQDPISISKDAQIQESAVIQRSATETVQTPISRTRTITRGATRTAQRSVTGTSTVQTSSTVQIPRAVSRPVRPALKPPTTRKPKRPLRVLPVRLKKARDDFVKRVFTVFTKPTQDSAFKATSISGTDLKDVVGKASLKVGTTAKASFIVKDDEGKVVDPQSLLGFTPFGRFRAAKSIPGAVVEKSKFRIDSPGELQEITFKGQRSRKVKGLFGGNR